MEVDGAGECFCFNSTFLPRTDTEPRVGGGVWCVSVSREVVRGGAAALQALCGRALLT